MTRNKVVLVRFPFDDLSGTKVRPAVCLTEPVGPHGQVVLAFITSRPPTELLESDLPLTSNDADFPATGLRVSSTLQLHRLMTTNTSLVLRELGELASGKHFLVREKLRKLFNLV